MRKSLIALDSLNLFLADVRDGIGPYLAIYLAATHHWDAASIGVAMSAMGLATLIAQTPAGAIIDRVRFKRAIMAVCSFVIAVACVAMTHFVSLPAIVLAQVVCGIAAAFLAPGLAAITLGLVGQSKFPAQTGRNEAFNHAGNVMAAILAGVLGYYIAREWIFYLVAAMALMSMLSVLSIQESEIDHQAARGCGNKKQTSGKAAGWTALFSDRRIVIFSVAMTLFHFANAAMLPLAGQLLSLERSSGSALYMSACIITAQLTMIPVALIAGRLAESWGRKPIFMIGLLALPVRGLLYTLSNNPYFVVAVQALDGIGAGIFGVVSILVIADLADGEGNFNLLAGAVMTAVGLGASLSNAFAGYIVYKWGFNAGFATLSAIAVLAVAVFYFLMPETRPSR